MKTETKILYHSPEAASLRQVTGWVSSTGRFYGNDERTARYDGCTHKLCEECGEHEHQRNWTCCDECRAKHAEQRYNAMPFAEWTDGMVYSQMLDRFFNDEEELREHLADNDDLQADTLRLVICEPEYAPIIDIDEMWQDYLPEDMYLSDVAPELADAIAKVNDILTETKPILSWRPGRYRTALAAADEESSAA
ncbi:hypothetical protein [Thalassospira xiamenensis]|uniref:hypothetical protein n=1 Tax=Thalassospira xiamenensis TaxID=220697 RepID=UPI000DEDE5CA|nr:hypothetical protein [Thalassospira xiamenensis]